MPDTQRDWTVENGLAYASEYFMGRADVQKAARKLAARLDELGIPYAIVGGLAVAAQGHNRVTTDVDVLVTEAGLRRFKETCLGLGWLERFPGSRGVRDVEFNTAIDFLLTGASPGAGAPGGITFRRPEDVSEAIEDLRYANLTNLIEMKVASGLAAANRLQDFADVISLVRARSLPRAFAAALHASLRAKFDELWQAAQLPTGEY